eukprot:scaffold34582_cov160-Amphora_coffeaeformis.AAC.3
MGGWRRREVIDWVGYGMIPGGISFQDVRSPCGPSTQPKPFLMTDFRFRDAMEAYVSLVLVL